MTSFYEDWAEIISTFVLIIGFLLALSFTSAVITYFVVFFTGLLVGRLWFRKKQDLKFTLFLILMALLLGLLLGSRYGNKQIIVILFVVGAFLSYYLHNRNLIKSV